MKRFMGVLLVVALLGAGFAQDAVWHGHWAVSSIQDEFTDDVRGVAFLAPVEQPSILRNMAIAVMCEPGGPNGVMVAVIDHPEFILSSFTKVTYRVDSKPAREGEWVSARSSVTPMGPEASAFLDELAGGERLILRVSPSGSTIEFALGGFSDAMRALGCYTGPL